MSLLRKKFGKYSLGIWMTYVGLAILLFIGMTGQAYSLLDWDGAVDQGVQNERFSGDIEESTWAEVSKSEAKADMIWFLPILIVASFGIIRSKLYGFIAAMMGFAIGIYFSIMFAFSRWDTYRGTVYQALILFTIPSILGIIGLWANRDNFEGISIKSNPA
ncbi:MAG: hypothetical protein GPJ54_09190 [Candidatus Heimdallarchaeota archaeon]|nr:hypothetical protein [Candidatus Heimdallarchaeota archaeon]